MSEASDKEVAALLMQLVEGLDLSSAEGRVGADAILREIEAKAPGALARMRTACAMRGATAH